MKVNPIGIQSYQQLLKRDEAPAARPDDASPPTQATKTTVELQEAAVSSRLAVKASGGSYADYLSAEEQRTLDILFDRLRNSDRFGSAYGRDASAEQTPSGLGKIVDVKV